MLRGALKISVTLLLTPVVLVFSSCGKLQVEVSTPVESTSATPTPTPDPLRNGLVGYWKLSEASGATTADDFSDTANDGTISASVTLDQTGYTAGKKSAYFSGVSDPNIVIPASTSYTVSGITLSGWINTTTASTTLVFNGDNNTGTTQRLFQFRTQAGGLFRCILFVMNAGVPTAVALNSISTINNGSWRHVACTYDGSTFRIYVDGVLDNSVAETRALNQVTPVLQVGRYWSSALAYVGYVSHVGFWNRALSSGEITDLMTWQ